MKGRRL